MNGAQPIESFSDRNVVLITPHDPRSPFPRTVDCCSYSQFEGEPAYLVIGPRAADARLARLADRLGLPVAELCEFRDAQAT